MKILAKHTDYQITLHRVGSKPADICVITFGGQPADKAPTGFGTAFCLEQGWDTIHVSAKHGTQYQGLSLEDFTKAVSPAIKGQDVVCYGPSMGGYAAVYYGGSINARIIAAAPLLPAWRPLGIAAYRDVPLRHKELHETPLSCHSPIIIFDPMLLRDKKVVDAMIRPAYPNARFVELPFAGHTILVTLSNARILKNTIKTMVNDDVVPDISLPTETSSIWHAEYSKQFFQTNPDKAISHLEKSIAIFPRPQVIALLLNILLHQRYIEAAQTLINDCAQSDDKNYKLLPHAFKNAQIAGLCVPEKAKRKPNPVHNKKTPRHHIFWKWLRGRHK